MQLNLNWIYFLEHRSLVSLTYQLCYLPQAFFFVHLNILHLGLDLSIISIMCMSVVLTPFSLTLQSLISNLKPSL